MPLYILVALGAVVGRVTTITPGQLAELALYLLSPAVVFFGAYQADLGAGLWVLPMISYSLCVLFMLIGGALARRLFTAGDGSARIATFSVSTGNTGYFGIPAVVAILGPDALAPVVMFSFGFTLYEATLGFYTLQRHALRPIDALKRVLKLPIVYAFFLGIGVNILNLTVPDVGLTVLEMLKVAFSVVGMMIVGLALSGLQLAHLDLKFHLFIHTMKFLVVPAAGFGIIMMDHATVQIFSSMVQQIILILCLVPIAANVAAFAAMFDMRPKTSALAVLISTGLALVILPVGLGLLTQILP